MVDRVWVSALATAIGMWGLVIMVSALVASYVARLTPERPLYPAIVSESLYGLISLMLIQLTGGLAAYPLFSEAPPYRLGLAVSLSLSLSLLMAGLARRSCDYEPPYLPRGVAERIVLLLLVAPIGEEMLFRGLLEGYLLLSLGTDPASRLTAVTLPAILFAVVHYLPYREGPPSCLRWVLAMALTAGLVAGSFLIYAGSLLSAVLVHSCFNLASMVACRSTGAPEPA